MNTSAIIVMVIIFSIYIGFIGFFLKKSGSKQKS